MLLDRLMDGRRSGTAWGLDMVISTRGLDEVQGEWPLGALKEISWLVVEVMQYEECVGDRRNVDESKESKGVRRRKIDKEEKT